MRPFNTVLNDPNRSYEMARQQDRILRFVCGTMPAQNVVGNREDPKLPRQHVTQALFDSRARIAHLCPFVLNAIDRDLFWIDESNLADRALIEQTVLGLIPGFIAQPPAFDPSQTQQPA